MAHDSNKDKRRFNEYQNLFVDYKEGDVVIYDNVKNLECLFPLQQSTNMIVFCTRGILKTEAKSNLSVIHEGSVAFFHSSLGIINSLGSHDFECKILCLSDHIIQGLLRNLVSIWHHTLYSNRLHVVDMNDVSKQEFIYYFELIHSKLKNSEPPLRSEIVQVLVRALLLELCHLFEQLDGNMSEQKMSQGKVLFNKFLSLVSNSDVKRQPITYYASQLAITPKYLTMLCLKYSNKTASQWVIQYTIEDIRFYLLNSHLSIKEISAKLGFANMSHFGSYVRKHLGVSPSEFRGQQ